MSPAEGGMLLPKRRLTGDPKIDSERMMQNLRYLEAHARFAKDYYPFNVQREAAAADMDTGMLWYDFAADLLRFRNRTADIIVSTILALPGFTWVNIPTGWTAQASTRLYSDTGPTLKASVQGIVVPWDGHIISLSYTATGNKSAGALSVAGQRNGSDYTDAVAMADGVNNGFQTWSPGEFPFDAGDELRASITTNGSFAPTTLDMEAVLYIARSQ